MLKKAVVAILAIILAITICGCTSYDTTPTTSTNPSEDTTMPPHEVDISMFRELETEPENLEVYRAEVQARLEYEDFLTPAEKQLLEEFLPSSNETVEIKSSKAITLNSWYEEINTYHFPVIFREGNSLVLWYTTEGGIVLLEELYGHWGFQSNIVGSLHDADAEVGEERLNTSYHSWTTYKAGTVTVWQFGEAIESYELPVGSVYCGFSAFEGHIFRHENDVYALNIGTFSESSGEATRIATGVEFVISANYRYGSDPWSQPLFLMEDGSIKCYISWLGDSKSSPDDPSHLCELRTEGGYH